MLFVECSNLRDKTQMELTYDGEGNRFLIPPKHTQCLIDIITSISY